MAGVQEQGVLHTGVLIVGAGPGAIACAVELLGHGFDDIVILEAGDGIGGSWMWNTYPGLACDVPSHLYSFSFARERDWSRLCAPQSEILDYLRDVADSHGVTPLVRTGQTVTSAHFDDERCRWTISTASGESYDAGALVLATGQLHRPVTPAIGGAARFSGETFHSARWNHEVDLRGKRIAVIGSGASAVQFVPEIVGDAGHTTIFQRTPNWLMPRRNRPYPKWWRQLIRRVPGLQRLRRRAVYMYTENLTQSTRRPRTLGRFSSLAPILFMRFQLRGRPELRERVWPQYPLGAKRLLFSSRWIPTLTRDDVELVTEPIAAITEHGVLDAAGTEHRTDVIIYATGYASTEFVSAIEITGAGGRYLADAWSDGPRAHLGMSVPGFPSMFLVYGPNSGTSGGSILVFEEAQARYIRQALEYVRDSGAAAIDLRADVAEAAYTALQARFTGTAWLQADSWFRDVHGRVVTNWPDSMRRFEAQTRQLDTSEYRLVGEREPALVHR